MALSLGTTRMVMAPTFRVPSATSAPIVASGNSGTDAIFTSSLSSLFAEAGEESPGFVKSTIPGSSLAYRWDNVPEYGVDAKAAIADYDVLHITDVSSSFNYDSNPSSNQELFDDTLLWAEHAWENGRGGLGAEMLWWATWPRQNADTARNYLSRFELIPQLQNYLNARCPVGQKPIRIVPGTWVFHRMWQDQAAELTPTATWYDDLFSDDFHFGDIGEYICSLLNICCIYGLDPADFTDTGVTMPTGGLTYIQGVIKDVVSDFPRAGVDTSGWA